MAGLKTKVLGHTKLDSRCTHCGKTELLSIVQQDYYTLFFIPTFPLKKKRTIICANCQTVYAADAFRLTEKQAKMPKTPWWGFSGLMVIGAIVAAGALVGILETQSKQAYLQDPQVGDLIIVSTKSDGETWYSYMKVASVDSRLLLVHVSKHSFSKLKGVYGEYEKAKVGVELLEDLREVPREQLKQLDIVSIKRSSP